MTVIVIVGGDGGGGIVMNQRVTIRERCCFEKKGRDRERMKIFIIYMCAFLFIDKVNFNRK